MSSDLLLNEACRLVLGATTPRTRAVAGYSLVLALEAFAHPDLATPIAAVLGVFDMRGGTDPVVAGALRMSGNAMLHRGLKAGTIDHKVGEDQFTFQPEATPLVSSWLVLRAVEALASDAGVAGRRKAGEHLRDGLGLLGDYPEATQKMTAFLRTIDIAAIAAEETLEQRNTG